MRSSEPAVVDRGKPAAKRAARWKWGAVGSAVAAVVLWLLLGLFRPEAPPTRPARTRPNSPSTAAVERSEARPPAENSAAANTPPASRDAPTLRERILATSPSTDIAAAPAAPEDAVGRFDPSTPTSALGMELDAGQFAPPENKGVYTSLFGVEAQGNNFAYVIDRSGSMGEPDSKPLRAAKQELLLSLERLGDLQQFQIIFYNERPVLMQLAAQPGRLVLATDENKLLAHDHLDRITAGGGTGHEEALSAALRLHPDVLYFLTDADEPALTGEQLARLAKLNDEHTRIHTIEFGRGPKQSPPGNFIEQLAKENGGEYRYVDVAELE